MYDARRMRSALRFALFGKCNLEVAHSDSRVTPVEVEEDQTASDSQFVQDEIRQEAERCSAATNSQKISRSLSSEFQARALRGSEREREIRLLRRASRSSRPERRRAATYRHSNPLSLIRCGSNW